MQDISLTLVFFVVALAISLLAAALRSRKNTNRSTNMDGATVSTPQAAFLDLRQQILEGSRSKFGLLPQTRSNEPWGVTMDWSIGNGTATVVALADGNASICLSSGGGSIGGGHSSDIIRDAALHAIAVAAESLRVMEVTRTFPLPQIGKVAFYVLTDEGVYTGRAPANELIAHRHPFFELGNAMQQIITHYQGTR
jgi:hypothetical protein